MGEIRSNTREGVGITWCCCCCCRRCAPGPGRRAGRSPPPSSAPACCRPSAHACPPAAAAAAAAAAVAAAAALGPDQRRPRRICRKCGAGASPGTQRSRSLSPHPSSPSARTGRAGRAGQQPRHPPAQRATEAAPVVCTRTTTHQTKFEQNGSAPDRTCRSSASVKPLSSTPILSTHARSLASSQACFGSGHSP